MEIAIMVLSWILSILMVSLIISMPVDKILQKVISTWKDSKEQAIYHKVELGALGVTCAVLLVLIVLMVVGL